MTGELGYENFSILQSKLLEQLKLKVPSWSATNLSTEDDLQTVAKVNEKLHELFKNYPQSSEKNIVLNLIAELISRACHLYSINPIELVIVHEDLGADVIASASVKTIGPVQIKLINFSLLEIQFRIKLLEKEGLATASNITSMIFVLAHELAHIGQKIFASSEVLQSSMFEYTQQPTEIHADKEALAYCQKLLGDAKNATQVAVNNKQLSEQSLILRGLNQTISEALQNGRPQM